MDQKQRSALSHRASSASCSQTADTTGNLHRTLGEDGNVNFRYGVESGQEHGTRICAGHDQISSRQGIEVSYSRRTSSVRDAGSFGMVLSIDVAITISILSWL
jgi:hypothetical protein